MTTAPTTAEWNLQAVFLMQSLLGAISPNFRMIVLDHAKGEWQLRFVLEHEDETDLEEIDDAATQFEAFQDGPIGLKVTTEMATGPLPWPEAPARAIYRRRED